MTTDVELLPLPEEEWNVQYGYYADAMREYARANVTHATAPLQAEIEAQYLCKGQQVYIEGSIRTSKYTGKDGIERYATDVIANEMQMLGGKQDGGQRTQRQAQQGPAIDEFEGDSMPF